MGGASWGTRPLCVSGAPGSMNPTIRRNHPQILRCTPRKGMEMIGELMLIAELVLIAELMLIVPY